MRPSPARLAWHNVLHPHTLYYVLHVTLAAAFPEIDGDNFALWCHGNSAPQDDHNGSSKRVYLMASAPRLSAPEGGEDVVQLCVCAYVYYAAASNTTPPSAMPSLQRCKSDGPDTLCTQRECMWF